MSWVHINTECISHSVNVTDADSQCHGCRHTIRWGALGDWSMSQVQMVNVTGADTQLGGELYRDGQCHGCRLVNVTGAHQY